jgi:hypothetical protein
MAKTTKKTTATKKLTKPKPKSTPPSRIPSTRWLGGALLIFTVVLTASFYLYICATNYGMTLLSTESFIILSLVTLLLFSSLFLLARPDRPPLFLSITGAIITAAFSAINIYYIAETICAIREMRVGYPLDFITYLPILIILLPVIAGLTLSLIGAIKRGASKPAKIVGFTSTAIATAVILTTIGVTILIFVQSTILQRGLEAQQRTAFTVVWPDNTSQDLICGNISEWEGCDLTWSNADHHISVYRSDTSNVTDEEHNFLVKAGTHIFIYVSLPTDIEDEQQLVSTVSAVFVKDHFNRSYCYSFHGLNSDIPYDEPSDCTTPFRTTFENGLIRIEYP